MRLEMLMVDILFSGKNRSRKVPIKHIREFFTNHLTSDYMEDPLNAHFSENVVFFGGNYTIFPGITSDITDKIKTLLESIFLAKNELSDQFKTKAEQIAILLLICSEWMAKKAKITRYELGENEDDLIFVPSINNHKKLVESISLDKHELLRLEAGFRIPSDTIDDFLVNNVEILEEYDPYDSIFIKKPFYDTGTEILFLSPTNIGLALYTRIREVAVEMGQDESLREAYHSWQEKKIEEYAELSGWFKIRPNFPENNFGHRLIEKCYQIDSNKLIYIALIKRLSNIHGEVSQGTVYDGMEQSIAHLNLLNDGNTKVLSVMVAGAFNDSLLMWKKPNDGNHSLVFSFSDFETVMQSEDLEPLMLWKFAKAHNQATSKSEIGIGSEAIDLFAFYKKNHGSLLPAGELPGYMLFMGAGSDYVRNLVRFRDEHAARRIVGGNPVDITVKRTKKFAPIYRTERRVKSNLLLVESYPFPLWIVCSQAKSQAQYERIHIYVEAIAFWMFKLSDRLSGYFKTISNGPIEINIELDPVIFTKSESAHFTAKEVYQPLELTIEQRTITLEIPFGFAKLFSDEDNQGEVLMIKEILKGFNVISRKMGKGPIELQAIENIIEEVLSPSSAKMIVYADSGKNPLLDGRNLPPLRYLMDTEQELIADHLVEILNPARPIPHQLSGSSEKHKLCISIVGKLLARIEDKLKRFRTPELLEYLVSLNEKLVFQSEYYTLLLPAKIGCYSNIRSEVAELKKTESKMVPTSLAVQGVIEFIIASPNFNGELFNLDEIDEIIALMDETITWASIADSITLLGNDPQIGLLPSGRIGIVDHFVRDVLAPFNNSRAETEVFNAVNPSDEKAGFDEGAVFVNNDATDAAFLQEWGVSFTTITALFGSLQMIGLQTGTTFMSMKEDDFFQKIPVLFKKKVSEQELKKVVELFSLDKRKSVKDAPAGFIAKDILPWRFNRALSYARRPILRITYPNDTQPTYHWGFRHVLNSYMSLTGLISSSKLKVQDEGPIESVVMSIFVKHRGKKYRQEVYDWMVQHSGLRLIPYEVKISESGHLVADRNYGDVDVMAIDDKNKIIYSIECKNTASARVVHEMKTELDSYVGQNGKGGHIKKHLNRHNWLKGNKSQLIKFVGDPEKHNIISVVLSSNIIPVVYLAKHKAALPIFSFRDMKRNGFQSIVAGLT